MEHSPLQNSMPGNDSTEHLINAVNSAVNQFVAVPRGIIERQAEQKAEEYVSSILNLDDASITKQLTKQQFIDMFTDKIKWTI